MLTGEQVVIAAGTVVESTAGRDQGRLLAVVDRKGEFVFLADGKVRKLHCPKRKNMKHLRLTEYRVDLSQITSDKKLRKVLSDFME